MGDKRTFEGRRIRDGFVSEPGHVLMCADYSQIELRALAHFCGSDVPEVLDPPEVILDPPRVGCRCPDRCPEHAEQRRTSAQAKRQRRQLARLSRNGLIELAIAPVKPPEEVIEANARATFAEHVTIIDESRSHRRRVKCASCREWMIGTPTEATPRQRSTTRPTLCVECAALCTDESAP